jgi:hypothetical protein
LLQINFLIFYTKKLGHFTSLEDIDIVNIITYGGMVRDGNGNFLTVLTDMKIEKLSLKTTLNNRKKLDQNIYDSSILVRDNTRQTYESIEELKFEKKQVWSSYMGYKSQSVFE